MLFGSFFIPLSRLFTAGGLPCGFPIKALESENFFFVLLLYYSGGTRENQAAEIVRRTAAHVARR
ncbi:hypothetical protein HMPREF7215_1140 [Pyramidobacter piscolens W5455]|uniref:Uncharacterized protein n=1 Tax=Pyramidobacter piscolens W5455 TaxID=352165 RepID=A0ABM9ZV92_9BACT|nr:hypothetical protein HMPREF7215_1140 [Pyramidobacter piscolens W5455]